MSAGACTVMVNMIRGHVQAILITATLSGTKSHEWTLINLSRLASKSGYTRKAFQLALNDAVVRGLMERKKLGKFWLMKVAPKGGA